MPAVPLNTYVSPELSRAIKRLRSTSKLSLHEWLASDPRVTEYLQQQGIRLPEKYNPKGRPKNPKKRSMKWLQRYTTLPQTEWDKGVKHVAELLGVCESSVWHAKRWIKQVKSISTSENPYVLFKA